jgi:hypothetical protein
VFNKDQLKRVFELLSDVFSEEKLTFFLSEIKLFKPENFPNTWILSNKETILTTMINPTE